MIATTISQLARYKGLGRHLDRAIDWLANEDWQNKLEEGRYTIDQDNVYALYQKYLTKLPEEVLFETHRQYIDIQILLEGEELIEVRPSDGLIVSVPYVVDIEFLRVPADPSHICYLQPGIALVFFPEDAHRPTLAVHNQIRQCRKLVLKVRVNS